MTGAMEEEGSSSTPGQKDNETAANENQTTKFYLSRPRFFQLK